MKIIQTGYSFKIYDDGLAIHDQLPADVYSVSFNKMTGWDLNKISESISIKEKVYGVQEQKTNKVLDAFASFNRNLGVLLSGDKGIGKSLFSKLLANKAINRGIPVIVVDTYIPGIASFLASIEQEVMVLFDEFDKTFPKKEKEDSEVPNSQSEMLTLFDGIAQGKKLFVITCNNLRAISDFLVNRPGRFHYHFRFDYPTEEEVTQYLTDKLNPSFTAEIAKVVNFSRKVHLNYDCLRAIAFEINSCGSFDEAIEDLNITREFGENYEVIAILSNGEKLRDDEITLDMFDPDPVTIYVSNMTEPTKDIFDITFSPLDAVWSDEYHNYVIDSSKFIEVICDSDLEYYKNSNPKTHEKWEKYSKLTVSKLVLIRKLPQKINYSF